MIKEQTQKYKFEIWLLKSTILDPKKSAILVSEEKCSSCFGFDSDLKTIDTQLFFWPSKTPFWPFWQLITFFVCVFKNTDQNNICASLVFNAKKGEKYDLQFFLHFLFQNLKMTFVGGQPIFSFLTSFFSFSF